MGSTTSSFRIPDDLKVRLEEAAFQMNQGKNWIIKRALEEYLTRQCRETLREEARRQSLLAGRKRSGPGSLWERAAAEVWND